MTMQKVPPELLARIDKILFVTHLAIGDFVYLKTFFIAFAQQYPHIKIDIFVDEVRKTNRFWHWSALKRYSLFEWLEAQPFITTVYKKTYSSYHFKKTLQTAQQAAYPLVISLTTLKRHKYACIARSIAGEKGFVAGINTHFPWYRIYKKWCIRQLDVAITVHLPNSTHVCDTFASWFEQLFSVTIPSANHYPTAAIPQVWIIWAKLLLLKWGIDKKSNPFSKIIFINAYAKNKKRTWSLDYVYKLIYAMRKKDLWGDLNFIVNIIPESLAEAKEFFNNNNCGNRIFLFSATTHFFQLPAIISLCTIVISVETAVMHLAAAAEIPVIALMRKNNPEWAPLSKAPVLVIKVPPQLGTWVKDITVDTVLQTMATSDWLKKIILM